MCSLEAYTFQAEIHAFAYLSYGFVAEHTEREGNVIFHRHRVEKGRALEEYTDFLAYLLHLLVLQFCDVASVVEDFPLLGLMEADEALEQHGLARTGLPNDEVVYAWLEDAVDAFEHRLFSE